MNKLQYQRALDHLEESYSRNEISYKDYFMQKRGLDDAVIDYYIEEGIDNELPSNYQGNY